jgi:hypothetical protein
MRATPDGIECAGRGPEYGDVRMGMIYMTIVTMNDNNGITLKYRERLASVEEENLECRGRSWSYMA